VAEVLGRDTSKRMRGKWFSKGVGGSLWYRLGGGVKRKEEATS